MGDVRLITANVNGIRAASRRGGLAWLLAQEPDVLCLQEVRASDEQLATELAGGGFGDWHVAHAPSLAAKGHAGVAVLSRVAPARIDSVIHEEFAAQGRWVEVDLPLGPHGVTIASTYVHTGEAGTPRQDEKHRFLDAIEARLHTWHSQGRYAVLTGDLNIAHHEDDLKNWRGNRGKAGFLDTERDTVTRWTTGPVRDVHRALHGPGPGPYSWWSWRGQAFDNDAGWRIDYHLATDLLAATAKSASVSRATSYDLRWSDHAPVTVDYAI